MSKSKYNGEFYDEGRPINERCGHATVFTEITPEQRLQAEIDRENLIQDAHDELFGGDDQ